MNKKQPSPDPEAPRTVDYVLKDRAIDIANAIIQVHNKELQYVAIEKVVEHALKKTREEALEEAATLCIRSVKKYSKTGHMICSLSPIELAAGIRALRRPNNAKNGT